MEKDQWDTKAEPGLWIWLSNSSFCLSRSAPHEVYVYSDVTEE